MSRAFRAALASMLLTIALGLGAGITVQQNARALGPLEAAIGRFIVRTISANRAETRDRRDINVRRDAELANVDLERQAVDYNLSIYRISPDEATAQRAQLDLKAQAIEDRARRERQIVSFETRRQIDANLRSTLRDAVKLATGADPRAVDFLANMIEGQRPLDAAINAATSGQPQDPRQPFRDLKAQLEQVEKAARALGGAQGIAIRERIREALAEAAGIAAGEGPPPDDKIQRLRDLEQQVAQTAQQVNSILRDLLPGSPGISRDRFAQNEKWREFDAAVAAASGPVAGREALSSINRRTIEFLEQQVAEGSLQLTREELEELARRMTAEWVDMRRSGETTLRSSEIDLTQLLDRVTGGPAPEPTATAVRPTSVPTSPPTPTVAPETATSEPTSPSETVVPTASPTRTTSATASPGTATSTATPTETSTPTETPTSTPTATPTPSPSPTLSPTATTAPITNFAGSWHSAGTCDNPAAPYRWSVSLTQNGTAVSGTIMFHLCPGGGQAGYSVSGTATSAGTVSLAGTKFHALGDLGANAPGQVTFTVAPGGAPSPNYAP